MSKKKVIIVGAGLCGSLLALTLAEKGHEVVLYEKRGDFRKEGLEGGRSINLALSSRGINALKLVGLEDEVSSLCIPMKGRMVHPLGEQPFMAPYSGREGLHINSVSRTGLNIVLINAADKHDNVTVKFSTAITKVDLNNASVSYMEDGISKSDSGDIVIGTDGAGSVVRKTFLSNSGRLRFNFSQDFLSHGYKELSIHPGDDPKWKIEKNALHIWPRGEFMIIALPNLDGSFTLTMFHPYDGEYGFDKLNTEADVEQFFTKFYPSLLPYIPHYKEEFFENPTSSLGTIRCFPWQANGKVLLMGDAAHAIVPFYGQGMNCSFEDVFVFDQFVNLDSDDLETTFDNYSFNRWEDTNAIADLAVHNYYEMRDHVDDTNYKARRKIELELERDYDYNSKYSMVTFRPDFRYTEAKMLGEEQERLLEKLLDEKKVKDMTMEDIYQSVKRRRM